MALKIVRKPDGSLKSKWFYGVFEAGGRRQVVNLDIPIDGKPPPDIRGQGDRAFEASKIRAQAKLDELVKQAHSEKTAKKLVEKFYEIETGSKFHVPATRDLPKVLKTLPQRRTDQTAYTTHRESVVASFVSFITATYPKAAKLSQITPTMAEAFMAAELARGISPKTYNDELTIMRQTFRRLQARIGLPLNPFADIPGRDSETVSKTPFTPDELKAILDAAQDDDFIRPLIVTAACTAMRRADCALLTWQSVNMAERFITVKTAKTGETTDIPIFPMLFDELQRRGSGNPDDYVFPEQAAMFKRNPDGLNARLRNVLWNAGFVDAQAAERAKNGDAALPVLPPEETRIKGLQAISEAAFTEAKRENMRAIFSAYMDGKSTGAIARMLEVSKGTVSGHLNEVEGMIEATVIQRQEKRLPPVIRGTIHAENTNGSRLRKANVKGWHSFRTTWVTLALAANVPLELVRRVTGHKTTEVVLQHYFRPGREQFRAALQDAMPKLLMNGSSHGHADELKEARKIVEATTAKTFAKNKKRILELLDAASR